MKVKYCPNCRNDLVENKPNIYVCSVCRRKYKILMSKKNKGKGSS